MITIKNKNGRRIDFYDLSHEKIGEEIEDKLTYISRMAYSEMARDIVYDDKLTNFISKISCLMSDNDEVSYKVILGNDWYIIYSVNEMMVSIYSIAMINRDKFDMVRNSELARGIEIVLAETLDNSDRISRYISADMVENTSYPLFLSYLVRNGEPLLQERYSSDDRSLEEKRNLLKKYKIYKANSLMEANPFDFGESQFVEFEITDYGKKYWRLSKVKKKIRN